MPDTKQEDLSGWGHYPVKECLSWRPEKRRDLQRILHSGDKVIARGLGRSYGDASLKPTGTVRTERLNHFISFDAEKGVVCAQAGVTLSELMDLVVPRGWFPYTIPGTRHITLGGAFACNIHGKNHYREGDFAEHVLSIRLMLDYGEVIECSPTVNSDIFWATAGGMGMTGIIESITFKLKPISSCSLSSTTYRVDSLNDMIGAFESYRNDSDYMVGWIDHASSNDEIGRGIFEAASHISTDEGGAALTSFGGLKTAINVPCFMPSFVLNRYSVGLYNKWRFRKYSEWRQAETIDFDTFFHPLDKIGQWNRLYGRRGFFQYQCLFPETANVGEQIKTFLSALHRERLFSFLAVIKYHRDGRGLLTFPKRGYSLALDFSNTRRVRAILPQLDRWVASNGGRTYLAKDAMLTPELFHDMYGKKADDWLKVVHNVDPDAKFTSLMSERLAWKQS